eukprot:GEMP01029841.1.p1 GENE.GEMP01029841.1~~GEMP01029841.1.p1  ORF type:complete len:448 (+),score=78.38 GEMP01029841.1:69-1412(+)
MDDDDEDLRRALALSLLDVDASVSSSTPKPSFPGPKAKRHRAVTGRYLLTEDERRRLFEQVFGPEPVAEDLKRWEDSYFTFSDEAKFGLWQRQGGPCGVLVPLQGLLLRILLFPRDSEGEALTAPPSDVSDERRWAALFVALSRTLARVTQDNVYSVVSADKDGVNVHSFGSYAEILQFYGGTGRAALSQPRSLVHFIYSLLLTRSPETIRNDMDDDGQPLIGRFGHCSQELVNLMLFGEATSNVFDGTQNFGGGMVLKGVTAPEVDVGYLSEVEAMRYVTVGERYKFSKFPIWVVGSQTHYTLLFSGDTAVCDASNNSEERRVREIFNKHCLDPEAGMCDIGNLDTILDEIQCDNRAGIKQTIADITSDIFVWSDLWSLLERSETSKVQKFTMHLYDGQDPPGPTLRRFVLETCDVDATIGQGDTDAFCGALRTRWPMCLVSGLQL